MSDKDIIHLSPLGSKTPAKLCAISGMKYFRKIPFDQLEKDGNVFVEWSTARQWRKKHTECYFIECGGGGIGETFYLIDPSGYSKNVTNYDSW